MPMIIPSGGFVRFPELVFVWAVFACVSMPRVTNSAIASCALIRPGHVLPLFSQAMFTKTSSACAVTKPNGSGQEHQPRGESYGNDALRVSLWPEGTVVFRPGGPGFILPDGSLSMKFGWWRHAHGKLTIEGKRLDSHAPPLRVDIPEGYGDRGFQATAIIFPTEGCWEITGKVGTATLTFVARVIKERGAGNR